MARNALGESADACASTPLRCCVRTAPANPWAGLRGLAGVGGRSGKRLIVDYQRTRAVTELNSEGIPPACLCVCGGELQAVRLPRLQYRLGNYTVAVLVAWRSRARLRNHVLRAMPAAFQGACVLTE
jgi:hypothetical protein